MKSLREQISVFQHINRTCAVTPPIWVQKRWDSYSAYGGFRKNKHRMPLHLWNAHKGHGWPLMWVVTATKPSWQPHLEEEYEVVARDEYGVPMQVSNRLVIFDFLLFRFLQRFQLP